VTEPRRIHSVHFFRRNARREERRIQWLLDAGIQQPGFPSWARGVRVEHAGPFQHAIVLTPNRGH
jgi:hypothetical protein